MKRSQKGDSKDLPVTSAEEVRHLVGPVADHTIAEILGLLPTTEDLEVAIVYAQGEGDVAGTKGHPLSGKSARIYEILAEDDAYQSDER
jgi:hypothetical protein